MATVISIAWELAFDLMQWVVFRNQMLVAVDVKIEMHSVLFFVGQELIGLVLFR